MAKKDNLPSVEKPEDTQDVNIDSTDNAEVNSPALSFPEALANAIKPPVQKVGIFELIKSEIKKAEKNLQHDFYADLDLLLVKMYEFKNHLKSCSEKIGGEIKEFEKKISDLF